MQQQTSPARLFCLLVGGVLVAAGVLGFFYDSSFGIDPVERDAVLGILDVNGWHNLVHILTGVIGLKAAGSYGAARGYAFIFGGLYLVVAALGFVAGDGEELFNLIPVNTEDNVLHLLIGAAGIWALILTPDTPAPSTIA